MAVIDDVRLGGDKGFGGGGKAGKNDVVNKCNKTINPAKNSFVYQEPYIINHKKSV
ncbi:MAG: hypothetical protein IJQ89_05245 [Bacteroidales bacterium]|nr:hypothetical protein [Bacteroidales bacterium]